MDDGRDGVEEGERVAPRFRTDRLGQGGGGEGTGRDDRLSLVRQHCHFLTNDHDKRMCFEAFRDCRAEPVPVDGERATRRDLIGIAARHDEAIGQSHLGVEQADRVLPRVVGSERVGAYELGQPVRLVGVGATRAAHLVQHDRDAGPRDLPGGLRPGETAADDVNGFAHGPNLSAARSAWKRPETGTAPAGLTDERRFDGRSKVGGRPRPRTATREGCCRR